MVFVNDPYDLEFTTKDSEHDRRQSSQAYRHGTKNVYMKSKDRFPAAKDFSNMFSNTTNKQRLQTFLKEEFANLAQTKPAINFVYSVRHTCWNLSSGDRCEEFECHHIEADTIMFFIYSHIRKSGILDPVVIDAEDTDVVVLLAFVGHNTEGLLAIKQKKGIINCRDLCPKDVADIIVPLHIFSG